MINRVVSPYNSSLAVQGLSGYIRDAKEKAQTLTKEEEQDLFRQMRQGNTKARDTLIESHLRLVIGVAKPFARRRKSVAMEELIQSGNEGLVEAVDRFNPDKGTRLSTYATWWIRQKIMKHFSEHDRLIRLPGHVVDNLSKVKRAQTTMEGELGRQPTVDELSNALDISSKRIKSLLAAEQKPASLEKPLKSSQGEGTQTLGDQVASPFKTPDEQLAQRNLPHLIRQAMDSELNEREKTILSLRFGFDPNAVNLNDNPFAADSETKTLAAIGEEFGVTRESIRQAEKKALGRLRKSPFLQQMFDLS